MTARGARRGTGSTCATRSGRRGASRTSRSRPGYWPPPQDAAKAAAGHEAVCVSHQLPIWTARRSIEGKRLWHDPRKRQCALGSVTSLTYVGGKFTSIAYHEPSGSSGSRVAGA